MALAGAMRKPVTGVGIFPFRRGLEVASVPMVPDRPVSSFLRSILRTWTKNLGIAIFFNKIVDDSKHLKSLGLKPCGFDPTVRTTLFNIDSSAATG